MNIKSKTNRLLVVFAQGIVLTWALWITVVAFTDLSCLMVVLNQLSPNFPASSHNFDFVLHFLKQYGWDNHYLGLAIFSMVVLWGMMIAVAYWVAFIAFFTNREFYVYKVLRAFLLNMSLFAYFIIADEVFIRYASGHSHMNQLLFVVTTCYVFLYLVGKKGCDCLDAGG